MGKLRRALIIPDCHIPFHDEKAYRLMIAASKDIRPDEIVILGDFADFFQVSSHPKEPEIHCSLIDEIDSVTTALRELRELHPRAKIVYLEGNHEFRLARYIRDKCSDLFGLIDAQTLLNLQAYRIEFVPYGPHQKHAVLGSSLIARHEPLGGGVHSAYQSVVKAGCSLIHGHTHRIQEAQTVTIAGENHRGISCGWLGDKCHPVMGYVRNHHQWALGFSVVTVMPDGKTWFNQLIHIINHSCWCDGKFYK